MCASNRPDAAICRLRRMATKRLSSGVHIVLQALRSRRSEGARSLRCHGGDMVLGRDTATGADAPSWKRPVQHGEAASPSDHSFSQAVGAVGRCTAPPIAPPKPSSASPTMHAAQGCTTQVRSLHRAYTHRSFRQEKRFGEGYLCPSPTQLPAASAGRPPWAGSSYHAPQIQGGLQAPEAAGSQQPAAGPVNELSLVIGNASDLMVHP